MIFLSTFNFSRSALARIYYGYVLFIFFIEALCHHLIHQLHQPVLTDVGSDNTYWLLHLLNIPQFIAGSVPASILFESMTIIVASTCFVFNRQHRVSVLFTFLLLIYMVTKNSFVGHHEHGWDLPLLMSCVFWTVNEERFVILFKAFRFYLLFAFVSAACWKICRGGIFLPGQFSEIMKTQHLTELVSHPLETYMKFIGWLISHPDFGRWLLMLSTVVQLSFLAGFFTYRLDTVLLVLFFLFFAANTLLMELSFYQWFVCGIVFLPWNRQRFNTRHIKNEFIP